MIFTERKITVNKGQSTIDRPVILYRGDYEVEIRFTIVDTDFKYINGNNNNATEKASHAQLAILGPDGTNVFSDISVCTGGQVAFVLTKEMIDELSEVGKYSFQIRLFDYYRESRVSIPPVEYGIEVREPVASEDHTNAVDNSMVGYSIAKTSVLDDPVGPTFDGNGQYNKTDWETGDRISESKLNKIEDAIDQINQNEKNDVAALDKKVNSNYNVIQHQVNNLVLESGGDSNLEVVQARGTYSVLNERLNEIEDKQISNVTRNLLNSIQFMKTSTNGADIKEFDGAIAFTGKESWGGSFYYDIKVTPGHKYAILTKVKGANAWSTCYQFSSGDANLGGARKCNGVLEPSGEKTDYVLSFACYEVTNQQTGHISYGFTVAQNKTAYIKDTVIMDLGEIEESMMPTLRDILMTYGYWDYAIRDFVLAPAVINSMNAKYATNAEHATNAEYANYAESGDFPDTIKEYKNELKTTSNISFWDNGCSHSIDANVITINPGPNSSWGGELLVKYYPNGSSNIDISNRRYLFTALVSKHEHNAATRVRLFNYSGNFATQVSNASSSVTDIQSGEYVRVTYVYTVPSNVNTFAVGLSVNSPFKPFKTKDWMLIDVTDADDAAMLSIQKLLSQEQYWQPYPKIAKKAYEAIIAYGLSGEYERTLTSNIIAASQANKFQDYTYKLEWTTKTFDVGTSSSWWIQNKTVDLDPNSYYIYMVRWEGSNQAAFNRCNELRNGSWYNTTTFTNEYMVLGNTKVMSWIFRTDDKVITPNLCMVTSNPTFETDIFITVELYKILDEKFIDTVFAVDIARCYLKGNTIKSYDFSDTIKWGSDAESEDSMVSKWKDKKVLVIGDSITAAGQWQRKIQTELGMQVKTHAKGGVGIIAMVDGDKGLGGDYDNETNASGTLYPLNTDDVGDKDLIVVLPAYNERGRSEGVIGDCYDPNSKEGMTITGMMQYLINRIYEELIKANNLNCKILIATPHCAGAYNYNYIDGYGEYPSGSGQTMETLSNTIEKVCNYNNLPVCDLWHNSGINRFTWTIYGANPNAINDNYTMYQLDSSGNVIGTSPMRYTKGQSYYQWRNGVVVLEEYTGSAPYPFMGDQLHCSDAGYARIGECIVGSIIRAYGY